MNIVLSTLIKNNSILSCDVSQVNPVRSTRTTINKRIVLSFIHHHLVEFSHKYCAVLLGWYALVLEKLERVYPLVMLGTISIGVIFLGERSSS